MNHGLKIMQSARLPYHGVPVTTEGQEHVPSSVGPMARSLSSLTLVMKELIQMNPWERDARCAPIPWRGDVFEKFRSKPLTIGLLTDDGVVRPHPPISRTLLSLVEKLRIAGHDIVEWNAELHAECIQVMVSSDVATTTFCISDFSGLRTSSIRPMEAKILGGT